MRREERFDLVLSAWVSVHLQSFSSLTPSLFIRNQRGETESWFICWFGRKIC